MTQGRMFIIREGRDSDLDQVERIEQVSFSDPWPRRALRSELRRDPLRMPLIAARQERVLGYLLAWRIVDQLHVLNLAVAPVARRRGVATALLAAAVVEARERGMREVTLEVRQSNAGAISFYEGAGFAAVGRRQRYYADTGEDALIMTLALERERG
jgi:ribosomal-protein-alanine N-acetyltransferase